MKPWLWAVVGAILAGPSAYVAGFYFRPEPEVRTVERVEYRERVVTRVQVQREESKTRVVYRDRVTKPDGTITEREVEREETKTAERSDTASDTDRAGLRVAERVVTPRQPDWRIGAMAGLSLQLTPVYGAQVERRLLGPLWLGAWGLSSGVAGLSLTLSF